MNNGPTLSEILLSVYDQKRPILRQYLRTKPLNSPQVGLKVSTFLELCNIIYNRCVLVRREHLRFDQLISIGKWSAVREVTPTTLIPEAVSCWLELKFPQTL